MSGFRSGSASVARVLPIAAYSKTAGLVVWVAWMLLLRNVAICAVLTLPLALGPLALAGCYSVGVLGI